MKIEVDEHGELMLSEVYCGIGIKTDNGIYGIAQRDSGIEVMLNGRVVYPPELCEQQPPTVMQDATDPEEEGRLTECCRCKWVGVDNDKSTRDETQSDGYAPLVTLVCPECGCEEFYVLERKP